MSNGTDQTPTPESIRNTSGAPASDQPQGVAPTTSATVPPTPMATPPMAGGPATMGSSAQYPAPAGLQPPQIPTGMSQADLQKTQAAIQAARDKQNAESLHTKIFSNVLRVMSGGSERPILDASGNPITDPNTGNIMTAPASRKTLGASILAGALSGLMSGFEHLPRYMGREQGYVGADIGAAAKGGAEAAAPFTQAGAVAKAQTMSDEQRLRAYTTLDHNFKQLQMAQAASKMSYDARQDYIDGASNQLTIMHDLNTSGQLGTYTDSTGKQQPILVAENLDPAGLQDLMKKTPDFIHTMTALPTDQYPVYDQSGRLLGYNMHWTVYHNSPDGKVPLSAALKAQFPKTFGQVPEGQMISIPVLTSLVQKDQQNGLAESAYNNLSSQANAYNTNKKDVTVPSYDEFLRQNIGMSKFAPQLGHIGTHDTLDTALASADTTDANFGSALRKAFGFPDTDKMAQDRKIDYEARLARAKEDMTKMTPEQLAFFSANEPTSARGIAATNTLAQQNVQAGRKAATEAAARLPFELRKQEQEQLLKTGTPEEAGALMASGKLTLTELKSRGSTPKFITDASNAAIKIDPNYNPQKADAEYKIASNQQNTTFFGSAKSLTDRGGTLDQLQDQYNKLGNRQIPVYNKWSDYLAYQAGDPAMAGFYQTAVGVADDYAKVMGGGVGSDTSRLQVMKSFSNAHNPAAMKAAIDAARAAVMSQQNSRIGSNSMLRAMYGSEPRTTAAPEGTIITVNGRQMVKRNGQWAVVGTGQ